MAHFAELDQNNVVVRVIAVSNNELLDDLGNEKEHIGISFCQSLFDGTWKQTSYHSSFRKNFAAVGYRYDQENDAFIPPQPYNSWVLNSATCRWEAPVPYPSDGEDYVWDEVSQSWVAG